MISLVIDTFTSNILLFSTNIFYMSTPVPRDHAGCRSGFNFIVFLVVVCSSVEYLHWSVIDFVFCPGGEWWVFLPFIMRPGLESGFWTFVSLSEILPLSGQRQRGIAPPVMSFGWDDPYTAGASVGGWRSRLAHIETPKHTYTHSYTQTHDYTPPTHTPLKVTLNNDVWKLQTTATLADTKMSGADARSFVGLRRANIQFTDLLIVQG